MLELALAEKKVSASGFSRYYASAKRAVDELVSSLDNIDTEGESTLEDGMISCSALQIGMFALTLPKPEQKPYIEAAERMMRIHTCLEQQLVPDCRCNGASLRYWESQYDVMVMANMWIIRVVAVITMFMRYSSVWKRLCWERPLFTKTQMEAF